MGLTFKDVDVASLSPMMQHYVKTKEENKDCIIFYRLGDFMRCSLTTLSQHPGNWN